MQENVQDIKNFCKLSYLTEKRRGTYKMKFFIIFSAKYLLKPNKSSTFVADLRNTFVHMKKRICAKDAYFSNKADSY